MLDFKKHFRRKKKAQRTEKQSSPSSVSPSPAPSTILTSPTPPVVSNPSNDENERLASPSRQTDAVASASSKLAATPVKEQTIGGKKSGKKDAEHRKRIQERTLQALDVMAEGANLGKNVSEVAQDASGPLKAAFGVSERVLLMVRDAVANDKAWAEFMETLEDHRGVLDQNRKLVEKNKQLSQLTAVDDEFATALEDYEKSLEEIGMKAKHTAGRFKKKEAKSYFMQPLTAKTQAESIARLKNDLNRSWNFLQGRINLSVRSTTMRVEDHVARMRISQILQVAEARGNSIGKLLPGTRTDIIQKISSWADDPSSAKQIFWLCDGPGTGKSTLAAHMANEWKKTGRFAGGFFFSREDEHTRDLGRFCATIAKQIIELHPRGERYIIDLPKDPSFLPFFERFDILIKGLIEHLAEGAKALETSASDQAASTSHPVKPLIIVIDSLDQCDAGNHADLSDQTRLLDALLHHLPSITSVKVLLTSTPLPDIPSRFHGSKALLRSEISPHRAASSQVDIELYVRDRMKDVLTTYQQDQVIESSNGVFQLASVSCRILENAIHRTSALAQLISRKHDSTFSNMYATLFDTIKEEQYNVEDSINAVRTVLQAVVLAYRPVTIATHHSFLPKVDGLINNYVQKIISWLKGIVKVGGDEGEGPVYILHPTFRTYLLGLSPGETFNIAAPAGHAFMASGCFKLLENLEYDLCGVAPRREIPLPMSNTPEIPTHVLERFGTDNSTPLRYAVVFWARHAAEGLVDEDMRTNLGPFFQNQLLKWIEWAATIRELPDCIVGLEELAKHLNPRVNLYSNPLEISALKWCEDALRFLKCQRSIIDQSAMQVYYSALAFDRPGSLVQSHYKSLSPHALPNVSGHLDVVHAGGVTATAVSRSGDIIASGSNDLICLWSADRQEPMKIVLEGNSGVITSLAFSSDGKYLASGSIDGTLFVWKVNEERGSSLVAALAGNGSEVGCLAFSDDTKSIMCGYKNGSIGIWSISEKICLSSYTIPPLASITDEGVTNDLPETSTCFIAMSNDHRTIALSRGPQLRVFQAENQVISEFLTIRYGRTAQPMFSRVLSTSTNNTAPTGSYLYWGDWVLDLADYQRDLHRFISKASELEANYSSKLDFAGPVTRPASLLYLAKQPARVNLYRMDEDAGVLLLPPEMDVSCWASTRTKIVIGTGDGRVALVEFADWSILGKEGEGFVAEEPNSDDGYETASDGPGDGADGGVLTEDFVSAVEEPMGRRGLTVPA